MALRNNTRPTRRRAVETLHLEKLHLRNVRAIKEQTLMFKPLTIVVGGNSAGKSTLLKSILLVAQTQRDTGNNGEVRLNGRLVTFDKFDAVIRNGQIDTSMSIGLEFVLGETTQRREPDLVIRTSQQRQVAIEVNGDAPEQLKFEIELGRHPATLGSAAVRRIHFETESGRLQLMHGSRVDVPLGVEDSVEISDFSGTLYLDETNRDAKEHISGVVLNGVIPVESAIKVSLARMIVDEILQKWQPRRSFGRSANRIPLNPNFVTYETSNSGEEVDGVRSTTRVLARLEKEIQAAERSYELLEILLREYLLEVDPDELAQRIGATSLMSVRNQICGDLEAMWVGFSGGYFETSNESERELFHKIQWHFEGVETRDKHVLGRFGNSSEPYERPDRSPRSRISWELRRYAGRANGRKIIEILEETAEKWRVEYPRLDAEGRVVGANQLNDFFLNRVHYVGPLRRGPETVTGYRMRGSAGQVGVDGENLAYLLSIDPTVSCPVWDIESGYAGIKVQELSLQSAVSYWMKQLELADQVTAREEPGIGDMIRLRMRGVATDLSPNDVGVGVSQAMPVIAAVLMARPGDLVIIEQPELHLHPNAQLALADFFLAATRSGRRILIESHSEHFLSRIRLRSIETAGDDNGWISGNVGFIFAEPELEGSDTGVTFREVEVTTTGEIADWPAGFFDQGPRESRRIFIRQQELDS